MQLFSLKNPCVMYPNIFGPIITLKQKELQQMFWHWNCNVKKNTFKLQKLSFLVLDPYKPFFFFLSWKSIVI
jgi:hypothetical protein